MANEPALSSPEISTFEVTVPAASLSELILAVHDAAAHPTNTQRKWKYGNVIGISGAKVRELNRTIAQRRHNRLRRPVAAVEVTQRRLTADVLFDVDLAAATASAHFSGAGEASQRHDSREEAAWASFLAVSTTDILLQAGVQAILCPDASM
ncbi:hypothetical protein [Antrihabitans stalactiti]|uniref:Uncharacterized protein n=1 Tax=Antrihabitans stalactiti TaxID=2584121 RepID=A0A848K9I7_9NOCA|nr:hypothetical protein [Antrihabitans stalactiti]NMN95081.1 hypothetical protein [Antrihabitans stalactiti]